MLTPEEEYLQKEQQRARNNKIKNRPIIVTTYFMVGVFMCLIGYVIYFMQFKAETDIANSRNVRQDSFSDTVRRGSIITSDGEVIAETKTDSEGNEYRYYPYSNMFSHIVGYDGYGKSGLELQGNFYMLRSHINIIERVYTEFKGEKNRGDNVITTVNYKVQKAAYDALGNCNGAVIAIEPSSGKIICMVSKPDYDPNQIDAVWEYMQTEEGQNSSVLLNRTTQGLYAPGSTFKVITLLEYMRENTYYNSYSYTCEGTNNFSGVNISCASGKVHGEEDLEASLAYSCNNSFANIGTTLDKGKYRETCEDLLFNSELPYQGEYVKSSFVIDSNSDSGQMPQTVIGQGQTQITPLHNAMIFCAIANGGVLMKPYLIEAIENDDGANIRKFSSKKYGSLISTEEAAALTEYLKSVCEYGTASSYFYDANYKVAGKTGTAEYDNEGNCNSWFVGFSNPDNPDLVVCVIVEDYESHGITGCYVARKVFDAYEEQ